MIESKKIIVDADACPRNALQICLDIGKEKGIAVWTVANINHNIISDKHITVDGGAEVADLKVMNNTNTGDIVVTQDWGLASMVLAKNAYCISPSGRIYKNDNIDFLMEERNLKAKHRRSGGRTKGPKKRSTSDDEKFLQALLATIKSK